MISWAYINNNYNYSTKNQYRYVK